MKQWLQIEKLQGRIDNMTDRMLSGKNFSQRKI